MNQNNKGMTLVEVVIAVAILGIMMPLFQSFMVALRINIQNREYADVTSQLSGVVELLKSVPPQEGASLLSSTLGVEAIENDTGYQVDNVLVHIIPLEEGSQPILPDSLANLEIDIDILQQHGLDDIDYVAQKSLDQERIDSGMADFDGPLSREIVTTITQEEGLVSIEVEYKYAAGSLSYSALAYAGTVPAAGQYMMRLNYYPLYSGETEVFIFHNRDNLDVIFYLTKMLRLEDSNQDLTLHEARYKCEVLINEDELHYTEGLPHFKLITNACKSLITDNDLLSYSALKYYNLPHFLMDQSLYDYSVSTGTKMQAYKVVVSIIKEGEAIASMDFIKFEE